MDRADFFDHIRQSVFGSKMTQSQVEGVTKILDYRDSNWPKMSDDELSYVLATATHETGHKMQPVREAGGERYLRSKHYYPWVGEGLVQVTWEVNAKKFGAKKPGDLMTWPLALRALFEGSIKGRFTGRKLADYIGNGRVDYVGARRIINGTDRAKLVAHYARGYRAAFQHAHSLAG